MTLGLPFATVAGCPAHVWGLALSPTRLYLVICYARLLFWGSVGAIASKPLLAGTLRSLGDAETSILSWGREFVECSISDAEVIAEGCEVCTGGLRTEETKKSLQCCTFQHFLLQVVKSVHRIDIKPTLLSCTANNDTVTFLSLLSAYAGPVPTVSVNVGLISGPCTHHMLFWLVSVETLH